MTQEILSNSPIDLKNDDLFGTKDKAEAIKEFLEEIVTDDSVKMICLYGNWGSGKSSIIKYLKDNINTNIFKSDIFEAWQHEKDNDLTLSLSEFIASFDKNLNGYISEKGKKFGKAVYSLFKAGLSTLNFSVPLVPLPVPGTPNVSFKPSEAIKSIEDDIETNYSNLSFYSKLKKFKESFIDLENSILSKSTTNQKIIVFIDDLDRCEPEHVISILSSIKNFFIYGKRTIFFCALDKDAVSKAISTKYKDVIKSEEYLEKIFDVSFTMPEIDSTNNLLKTIFTGNNHSNDIEEFFKAIEFNNPRHIKKVLNKYLILLRFKNSTKVSSNLKGLIPNILDTQNNKGELFETIFTLYIIILYEFFNDKFKEIEDYDTKINGYFIDYSKNIKQTHKIELILSKFNFFIKLNNKNTTFYKQIEYDFNNFSEIVNFIRFISLFTPKSNNSFKYQTEDFIINANNDSNMKNSTGISADFFINQFDSKENKILYLFCKYLLSKKTQLQGINSTYKIFDLFKMAKVLL